MTGGVGLCRNSCIGFVVGGDGRRLLLFLVPVDGGLLVAARVGVNLLAGLKLLLIVGLLKPRPAMFPRGTEALVLEGVRARKDRTGWVLDTLLLRLGGLSSGIAGVVLSRPPLTRGLARVNGELLS